MGSILFGGIVLILCLALFFFRKQFTWHGKPPFFFAAMYHTRLGVNLMSAIAVKWRIFFCKSSTCIIILGFIGMLLVSEEIIRSTIQFLINSYSSQAVSLVLPIKAKGVFYVPFLYWIFCLIFIALVHEGGHGVLARAWNVPIKSSGVALAGALIPLIPGAFVEPDEKKLAKKPRKQQLAIFAAGPMANVFFGFIFLAFFLVVLQPIEKFVYDYNGIEITELFSGETPARIAGLTTGQIITSIGNVPVHTTEEFIRQLNKYKPGEIISIIAEDQTLQTADHSVTLAGTANRPLLGVFVETVKSLKPELETYSLFLSLFLWLSSLVYWLAILNLGVGLFNLLPVGPLDGGRMLHTILQRFMPHRHAKRVWFGVSFFFLSALISGLVIGLIG